jgi:hypothetical protein
MRFACRTYAKQGSAYHFYCAATFGRLRWRAETAQSDDQAADQPPREKTCGWCKDKWGVSWQITPRVLTTALVKGGDAAKRAFEAMMPMTKIAVRGQPILFPLGCTLGPLNNRASQRRADYGFTPSRGATTWTGAKRRPVPVASQGSRLREPKSECGMLKAMCRWSGTATAGRHPMPVPID